MRLSRRPFLGRTQAIGYLIDPSHSGPDGTPQRVAAAWRPGASLHEVGPRLLVRFPAPVTVRAEHAPGLPVEGSPDVIELHDGGEVLSVPVAELPKARLAEIVDLSGLHVAQLSQPPPVPTPPLVRATPPTRPEQPPLRKIAGIGKTDPRTKRQIEALRRDTENDPNALQRLLGRSSPGRLMRRRNARYIEELSSNFRRRDWDRALRSAISVGGLGGGGWSMRLPSRQRVTGPGGSRTRAKGSLGLGDTVQQHLRRLYSEAATQLEREGEVMLAAFVHADLLDNPYAAIELIERHGDYRRAAEFSEGWLKDPAMTVRLWWRAGDRQRAVDVARSRGVFASAVTRLERVDRAAAEELRADWVADLQRSGDHLGAVRAAWPVAGLRPRVIGDIATIVGGGGRSSGIGLAHLLELNAEPGARAAARSLLADEPHSARDGFIAEIADHVCSDPAADRELASLALLALVRSTGSLPARTVSRCRRVLQRRADPLVVADLPRIAVHGQDSRAVIRVDLTDGGSTVVFDAVGVADDHVLVALGERGARLLTHDGRVRTEWETPTYSLVLADHRRRALLVAPRGDRCIVSSVDLPTGRAQVLPPLPSWPLPSYDGRRVILAGSDGVEWAEVENGHWKVVWRELTEGELVDAVQRSEQSMSVLFARPGRLHVWQWELPGVILRASEAVELPQHPVVLASGILGTLAQARGIAKISWHSPHGHRINTQDLFPEGEVRLLPAGSGYGILVHTDVVQRITVRPAHFGPELAVVDMPLGVNPILRSDGGMITVGHSAGRVVVIDPDQRRTVADIALKE